MKQENKPRGPYEFNKADTVRFSQNEAIQEYISFDPLTLTGSKHLFDSEEAARAERCFVYFLYKDNELVYVGQTTAGIKRINAHEHGKKSDFTEWTAIKVPPDLLDEVEAYFIIKYRPRYNTFIPFIEQKNNARRKLPTRSITFQPKLLEYAEKAAEAKGMTLSEYLNELIYREF